MDGIKGFDCIVKQLHCYPGSVHWQRDADTTQKQQANSFINRFEKSFEGSILNNNLTMQKK